MCGIPRILQTQEKGLRDSQNEFTAFNSTAHTRVSHLRIYCVYVVSTATSIPLQLSFNLKRTMILLYMQTKSPNYKRIIHKVLFRRTPGPSTISGPSTQFSDFGDLTRNHHSTPRSKEAEDVGLHNGGVYFSFGSRRGSNFQRIDASFSWLTFAETKIRFNFKCLNEIETLLLIIYLSYTYSYSFTNMLIMLIIPDRSLTLDRSISRNSDSRSSEPRGYSTLPPNYKKQNSDTISSKFNSSGMFCCKHVMELVCSCTLHFV